MSERDALRRLAEDAARAFGPARRIAEGRSGRDSLPTHTPPAARVMKLEIRCACGHSACIDARPAELIGRRLRCKSCGQDPVPF